MSADFNKILIQDDRISNLTDKIDFAVMKGAQQITVSEINATSKSPSSIVFNVVVPSLETIVDRHVMIKTTLILKVTGTVAVDSQLISYGFRDALGAFPMHSLINTMSCTINNNTVSMNVKDVLPALVRMLDNRELARYNNTTPVLYDSYLNYADMISADNSSFNDFGNNLDQFIKPRGAFALDSCTEDSAGTVPMSIGVGAGAGLLKTAYIKITLEEPLLLSPFIFGNPTSNNQGMYGIANMSYNLTLGSCNRFWRHIANAKSVLTDVSIESIEKSSLMFTFLSPHPSQQLNSRCILPYYEFNRYITNGVAIAGLPARIAGAKILPLSETISSSTVSFNCIPDKLVIFLRKPVQTWTDSDSFLTISKININWNNSSGVASSYTQSDLWRMSVKNGSNQSWDEFRGYASKKALAIETTAGTGAGTFVPTCGSVLILAFGTDIPLINDYDAPSSIGNYTFQIAVTATNYYTDPVTPELVICTLNSGCMALEKGTSSTYLSLLTKADVLEASQMEPTSHSDAKRMVGGGFLDSLKSVFRFIGNNRKTIGAIARTGMDAYSGKDSHAMARGLLSSVGAGRSGGGRSGGSQSGGSLMSRLK
jgi:hypothetical protein